jgi:hypothetical protein
VTADGTIVIGRRFRGPAASGNGGYTAGVLAARLSGGESAGPVTVTLRRPPPLDVPLEVRSGWEQAGRGVEAWYDDALVAGAVPGTLADAPVPAVDFGVATGARSAYRGAEAHPFPHCFVCGPDRGPGDGLRLTPGLVAPGRTACIWVPEPSLVTGADRTVAGAEFVWAALDCPGGWTSDIEHRPMVLGRMTAECLALPRVGRPYVVVGALLREDGRKTFTATAVYDADHLVGRAEQVWIVVDPTTFHA